MTAGDLPYILSFVYAADDDIPIATGDPTYVPGIMKGKMYISHPRKVLKYLTYWLGTNANPAGIVTKKMPVHESLIKYQCAPTDGIPFLWSLGKATAATPAANQFTIQGSVDGDVPDLIAHKENNLMYSEQAKEYESVKHTGGRIYTEDGILMIENTAIAQREYNMTANSVEQQADPPIKRGSVSPNIPYKIRGNANLTLAWDSLALGSFLVDIGGSWENDVRGALIEDGIDYAVALDNHGRRTYSELVIKLVQVNADNDLPSLEASRDLKTKGDLVLTVPRRHANDYLKLTFEDAYLKSCDPLPTPDGVDDIPIIEAVFCGITDIVIVDRQVTAAGVAAPNADADYGL